MAGVAARESLAVSGFAFSSGAAAGDGARRPLFAGKRRTEALVPIGCRQIRKPNALLWKDSYILIGAYQALSIVVDKSHSMPGSLSVVLYKGDGHGINVPFLFALAKWRPNTV